jgi:hypothetical protein
LTLTRTASKQPAARSLTMTQSTKIDFRHRRISQLADITDLVEVLFPGNSNQQHAAAQILLLLKQSTSPMPTSHLTRS